MGDRAESQKKQSMRKVESTQGCHTSQPDPQLGFLVISTAGKKDSYKMPSHPPKHIALWHGSLLLSESHLVFCSAPSEGYPLPDIAHCGCGPRGRTTGPHILGWATKGSKSLSEWGW